jgi:hypothetical protein
MTLSDYRPKFTMEITELQQKRLANLIPWGTRRRLITVILDDVLDVIEQHGEMVIAALLSKRITIIDLLKAVQQVDKEKQK